MLLTEFCIWNMYISTEAQLKIKLGLNSCILFKILALFGSSYLFIINVTFLGKLRQMS